MTREEAIIRLQGLYGNGYTEQEQALDMAIKALRQTDKIEALGEELRKVREGIKDENVLIGFNMAVAICNKHLGERSEK